MIVIMESVWRPADLYFIAYSDSSEYCFFS